MVKWGRYRLGKIQEGKRLGIGKDTGRKEAEY